MSPFDRGSNVTLQSAIYVCFTNFCIYTTLGRLKGPFEFLTEDIFGFSIMKGFNFGFSIQTRYSGRSRLTFEPSLTLKCRVPLSVTGHLPYTCVLMTALQTGGSQHIARALLARIRVLRRKVPVA